ncbi:M20/M25/M40 family metallo-hydrolase [Catenulispora sp. NF23]|uniref:M20/M25/M40 family metallo-hydrolase n=1 Tax=Catenulispora pinistramenti TaxID=2705254 RepID=UPI001BA63F58|nr:M20/M25/M40 family metallo-hydrolase [Catenulispora pinistramenti]MBS2539290.1 M20/M25/M40 family metallo-hydrolase [Catenulispora pinistramenti]
MTEHGSARSGPTRRQALSGAAVLGTAATLGGTSAAGVAAAATSRDATPAAGVTDVTGVTGVTSQRPSRDLRELLAQIDPERLKATVLKLTTFGTRHTLSSQTDPARGIGAATDWVAAQLEAIAAASGGRMTVQRQTFVQPVASRIPVPTPITNVIATLKGTAATERVYVVTGHLDSRVTDVMNFTSDAPGADDDGSGVAAVLEMARLFATRGFPGTLVFATVAGEEQGLYGSAYMAAQMKQAGADVQGMFSNDIVGASSAWDGTPPSPHTVRLFVEGVPTSETAAQAAIRQEVGGENDGPSRQLARFARDVAANDATDMDIRVIWRRDRYLRGSDHISFLEQAYPAGRFTEPRENFDHEHQDTRVVDGVQFGDLAEFCDFDYLARVTRVNAATLWSLAAGPGTPKGVTILTTPPAGFSGINTTTLTWTRGDDAGLAGYEVVLRETTAAAWTEVLPVGDVTTVTLPIAKDNVQFGLRAVGVDGMRSPVAFPVVG